MYIDELINAGLKEKEALIYNTLLVSGVLPVTDIIKKTNLKRGIVYKTLYDLTEKGLVSEATIQKKLHFKAEHPYKLTEFAEDKLKEAQKNQSAISNILPQLITSFKVTGNKPGIKFYEGVEGIKEVFMDTISTKQKIYSIRQTSELYPGLYDWFHNIYKPQRRKNEVWTDVILTEDSPYVTKHLSYEPENFREIRYIRDPMLPKGIEMNIYGDKVAFINFNKDTDLFAIVIQNPLIVNTQKSLFALAWETAGTYAKNLEKNNNKNKKSKN